IRQEILLGVGGCKMLAALDIHPTVYHMNEGHSAFLSLELTRSCMEKQSLSYAEARELASASLVFTTHTPVTAGHDYFPPEMMDRYFSEFVPKLGIDRKRFLALGRRNPEDEGESFCMTTLALRMANFSNGVSRLHGQISRRMWQALWPDVPEDEIPITHITNGVHFQSWISQEMEQLYERYLGPSWREQPAEQTVWRRVESIAAEELWHTHERRRERLVSFTRKRLQAQLQRRGASQAELESIEDALDPDALTIGFARRFATYKRATLLLRDKSRLANILNDTKRPVQIIFAGKAHPLDDAGKALIQQIATLVREPQFRRRMVFLEDYDVSVARYLVQGVDVWLNTPLRPNEASGTSGMKALANGAINLSILDGWWDEAYVDCRKDNHAVGWAIGQGEAYADRDYQDQVEAEALYDILERDVIPTYYDRRADGLPRRWISLMMSSIGNLCPRYNTNRMIREYTEQFYLPAHADHQALTADNSALAKAHAALKKRIRTAWSGVRVELLDTQIPPEIHAGETVHFSARVYMGSLTPEDLKIELYAGPLNAHGQIISPIITEMQPVRKEKDAYVFEVKAVPCCGSGQHGYTARVVPRHPDEKHPFALSLIAWAG
ncbi:MAG: alpha-glucan phosphorylase, partial [candidate division NC10 bacterium]|nr:alpha-glucan phosphorylase [candidate division NC10 bacterium]